MMMEISRRKLKKAPLPWISSPWEVSSAERVEVEMKLLGMIRAAFRRLFGENATSLNSGQRKAWGEFLLARGIVWEIKLPPRRPPAVSAWEGWEFVRHDSCNMARPKGIEGYRRAGRFHIPPELAMRMLVLEELL